MVLLLMFINSSILIYKELAVLNNKMPAQGMNSNMTKATGLQMEDSAERGTVNIMVSGLDKSGLRADVIMLINYEPISGRINMLSIPRDTMITYKGREEKINELYSQGKEQLLMKCIGQFTKVKIDYYVTVSVNAFRKVVDTLGGVYINVPFNMDYEDPSQNLYIHLTKGSQLLNGAKAEQFVRYRKSSNGNGKEIGDFGRIGMQSIFFKELINQKLNIKYLSKADDLFLIMKKYLKTNFEASDFTKYLPYATNIGSGKICALTVPGKSIYFNDLWYYIADEEGTSKMIKENFAR